MWDSYNTTSEIAAAHPTVAVFGIGAIVQHSLHLPVGTEWLMVREATRRVAEEMDAFLVPAYPHSSSQCHGFSPGTLWLKPTTLAMVVRDIVASLHAQGILRVILVNGHGGSFVLEALVRDLNSQFPDMMIILCQFEGGLGVIDLFEHSDVDCHAGEIATSMMLAIRPDLVREDSVDFVPTVGREFYDYLYMNEWAPDGVTGFPSAAGVEKGRRAFDEAVKRIISEANETFAALESLRGTHVGRLAGG